jgi:prephenate dehydrogenase
MFTTPATAAAPRHRSAARPRLGLIGLGAFGQLCRLHLAPHFDILVHDPALPPGPGITDLATAAAQPVVLLAVPVAAIAATAAAIAPHLQAGALVVEVCSLKSQPLAQLRAALPPLVEILGTHPLFGPQSGREGIVGLRIVVCPGQGPRARLAERFLRRRLRLQVIPMTAEAHDRQMAYVQGLTHLLARVVIGMDLPPLPHTTASFDHLMRMTEMLRHDSEALFRTITTDNPYMPEVKARLAASLAAALAPAEGQGRPLPALAPGAA